MPPGMSTNFAAIIGAAPDRPLIIGHRGTMGTAPENTMVSFAEGVAAGADIIEFDVQLSGDGRVIVMHDERVDRTTAGSGFVRDMELRALKSLDAGSKFGAQFAGEKVPTLEEMFAWARGQKARSGRPLLLAVEIKQFKKRCTGIVRATLDLISRHEMSGRCLVISFDAESVSEAAQNVRSGPDGFPAAGLLCYKMDFDLVAKALTIGARAILPRWNLVDDGLVRRAHESGLLVATWVVNEPPEFLRLAGLGVDVIGTNYPAVMRKILK